MEHESTTWTDLSILSKPSNPEYKIFQQYKRKFR